MLTNYSADKFLRILVDKQYDSTSPQWMDVYLGLSRTAPTRAGQNIDEPTTGTDGEGHTASTGYQRQRLSHTTYVDRSYVMDSIMSAPGDESGTRETYITYNESQIAFNKATANYGTIEYACLFDSQTGGNLLWYGALTNSISPTINQVPVISAKELEFAII